MPGIGLASNINRHLAQQGKDDKRRAAMETITYFAGESANSPIDPAVRRFEMVYNKLLHLLVSRGVSEKNYRAWVDEIYFPEGRNDTAYKIAADALSIRMVEIERVSRQAAGVEKARGWQPAPLPIHYNKALVPYSPGVVITESTGSHINRIRTGKTIYLLAVVA